LNALGIKAKGYQSNADFNEAQTMVDVIAEFGTVDILINNAESLKTTY
jgi:NAD(P)-dependent dehydrogenase (short-subunit alcohol dehydrogenase family)